MTQHESSWDPKKKRVVCYDCRRVLKYPDDAYGAKDEVWLQAWPEYVAKKLYLIHSYEGPREARWFRTALQLCLGCLEKRLGRALTMEDLTDAPINLRYQKSGSLPPGGVRWGEARQRGNCPAGQAAGEATVGQPGGGQHAQSADQTTTPSKQSQRKQVGHR